MNIKLFVLIFLFMSLFAGCGSDGAPSLKKPVPDQTSLTFRGVLKSLGTAAVNGSRYLLVTADGTIYRLAENEAKIDSANIGKKILIKGYLSEAPNKDREITVLNLELDTEKITDVSGLNEWRDFESSYNGISLKRKSNWLPEQDGKLLIFYLPLDRTLDAGILDGPEQRDKIVIENMNWSAEGGGFLSFLEKTFGNVTPFQKSEIGMADVQAYKREMGVGIEFFIKRDPGVFYRIQHLSLDTAHHKDFRNQFFDLIFSLKFIDFNDQGQRRLEITFANNPDEDITQGDKSPKRDEAPVVSAIPSSSLSEIRGDSVIAGITRESNESKDGLSSARRAIIDQMASDINVIASEKSGDGAWIVRELQFVDPDYVYVEFGDSSVKRKILIKYDLDEFDNFETVGYFEPGEDRDWVMVKGENPVASGEKVTYNISESGMVDETIVVKSGFRYFESKPMKFKIQYPANWYYSGYGAVGDAVSLYKFSDKPIDSGGKENISLRIIDRPIDDFVVQGDRDFFRGKYDNEDAVFVTRSSGGIFVVSGESDIALLESMARSIIE